MDTGTKISAIAHVSLIGWALFGGTFRSEPLPTIWQMDDWWGSRPKLSTVWLREVIKLGQSRRSLRDFQELLARHKFLAALFPAAVPTPD